MNPAQTITLSPKDMDKVFVIRSKIGSYVPLDLNSKMFLQEKYQKNPHPTRFELEEYSRSSGIPLDKIQNFFKYQRKVELKSGKQRKQFPKHRFNKAENEILEKAFRENSKLDEKTKNELEEKIGCKGVYVRRWFNYRNKKLERIRKSKAKQIGKPLVEKKPESLVRPFDM